MAKKGEGLIIGIGPAEDEGAEMGEMEESSSDLAAKALIKAVKAGDAAGVVSAFRELLAAEDDMDMPEMDEGAEDLEV